MFRVHLERERLHCGLGMLHGHTRFKAAHHSDVVVLVIARRRIRQSDRNDTLARLVEN